MIVEGAHGGAGPRRAAIRAGLLLVGLALATTLRLLLASGLGGTTGTADFAFSASVLLICALAGMRLTRPRPPVLALGVGAGLAGGAVLLAVPIWQRTGSGNLHAALAGGPGWHGFGGFTATTLVVAGAEETLLRGALWDALREALGEQGEYLAVVVGAAAFALLHVPWYGWGVVPLDLAAGAWLGGLRLASGGLAAPLLAHVGADLGTWWLL